MARAGWIVAGCILLSGLGTACGGGGGGGGDPAPQPVLDQSFTPGDFSTSAGVSYATAWAQTVVPAVSGTLDSVDLLLVAQGPDDVIRVDVRGVSGSPLSDDGSVLGSVIVAAADLPFVDNLVLSTFDFRSQGIPVVAGQTLAIVVTKLSGTPNPGDADVLLVGELANGYVPGGAFQRNGGSGVPFAGIVGDFYFAFRVVPE